MSPLHQPPHLHVTSGDEALVLDVTHLEELACFLQYSVVAHIPTLTCSRFAAPLLLPYSSGRRAVRCIGGGMRKCESCHYFCKSVAVRELFLRPSREPSADGGVEKRDPEEVEFLTAPHQRLSQTVIS